MTIDQEIEFWRKEAQRTTTDAAFVAIGVSYGLAIAQRDYMPPPPQQPGAPGAGL